MWNSSGQQMGQRAADPTSSHSLWTADQLLRLEYEWRRVQRAYAYHPSVRVQPSHGDPPDEYQIEYHVRTLAVGDSGQLDYLTRCTLEVRLPPEFPHAPPVVRPLEGVFHPNVTGDAVLLIPGWEPTHTLVDLVGRLGMLLAYQTYDPYNVWNPVAAEWMNANADYLPTDPAADFRPDVGGEPIGRVCRQGAATLAQLRGQLTQFQNSLLDLDAPPTFSDAQHFAQRVRMAASLFLADDLPESLRSGATQVDEWATQMRASVMTFDALRRQKGHSHAADIAAGELSDASRALQSQLTQLEAMVANGATAELSKVFKQLPPTNKLQSMQGSLRTALHKVEHKITTAKVRRDAAAARPPQLPIADGPLDDYLQKTAGSQNAAAVAAVDKSNAALAKAEPMAERSRAEVAALERIILWREFADLLAKGAEAMEKLKKWGSAGVQAYYLRNEGGEYGPFDFEQKLDLGGAQVAVKNTGRTSLEAWDLITGARLGKTDEGKLTAAVADPAGGEVFDQTFRLTARCDDLGVQFEYLVGQTRQLLKQLQLPPGVATNAPSWAGRFTADLAASAATASITADHDRRLKTWNAVASDLAQLGPFKERLATYLLADRLAEMIPRWQKELRGARAAFKESNDKISDILSRCARDIETDRPIMPAKYAKTYQENVVRRDDAKANSVRLDLAIKAQARQLETRLHSRTLWGEETPPQLTAIEPLPQATLNLAPGLGQMALEGVVAGLEKALGRPLRPQTREAPAEAAAPTRNDRPPHAVNRARAVRPTPPQAPPPPPRGGPGLLAGAGEEPAASPIDATEPAGATTADSTVVVASTHEPPEAADDAGFIKEPEAGEESEASTLSDDVFGDWPTPPDEGERKGK